MEKASAATYACFNARCARYRKELHGMAPEEFRAVTGYPPTCRSCGERLWVLDVQAETITSGPPSSGHEAAGVKTSSTRSQGSATPETKTSEVR